MRIPIVLLNPGETSVASAMIDDMPAIIAETPAAEDLGAYNFPDNALFNVQIINVTPDALVKLNQSLDSLLPILDRYYRAEWQIQDEPEDIEFNNSSVKRRAGAVYDWIPYGDEMLLLFSHVGKYTTVMMGYEY